MESHYTDQSTPLDVLQNTFGYSEFRSPQNDIIEGVMQGQNALVLMPTGGGKSLCYQIPALLRRGVGIVVSPLIALMQDQVDALQQLGINACYLNSTLNATEVQYTEEALYKGEIDLLYIAPERLLQERTLSLLRQVSIALFAIDEAHCVSQWGHDFREDYLQLSLLHQQFPQVPRIALTATADERTREEITTRLSLAEAQTYICGFDRPNIQYRITQKNNARQQLLRFLQNEHAEDTGIVYCLSRKKVEETAQWLVQQGFKALPYHAGMAQSERKNNQARFLREDAIIIVATIAFGMGIDKPDVRFVAHMNLPKSVEAYYQETGRAGRDRQPATAWMAYGLQDVITLKRMLDSSQAAEQHKRIERYKLDAMLGLCETTHCRRQSLLSYFGDKLEQPCGNCDTCISPINTWDASIAAQKALSCVYRTGQVFGVKHLVEVLLGKDSAKISQFSHDKISTYGVGKELDENQWRSVYRQLVSRGYLNVDLAGYGGLQLAEQSRPLLKGEETLLLRQDQFKEPSKPSSHKKQNLTVKEEDAQLWQALREKRKELAKKQNVPPYVIFHDATLMELVNYRPATLDQFSQISGVGQSKLKKFGDIFIEVIHNDKNASGHQSLDTIQKSNDAPQDIYYDFTNGLSADEIAESRDIALNRVYTHLARFIEKGALKVDDVVNLSKAEIDQIQDAIFSHDSLETLNLKELQQEFGDHYSLNAIRCVYAGILHNMQ